MQGCDCFTMAEKTIVSLSCAGEHVGPHQLLDILGCAAGLQSVLWTCGLWPGDGHHADWSPCILSGCSLEEQTQMDLQASRWDGLCCCSEDIQKKNIWIISRVKPLLFVLCLAERVTYKGQKLCYVVFPQEDPLETEPLTASKATDWAVQPSRNSLQLHLYFQFLPFGQIVDGEGNGFVLHSCSLGHWLVQAWSCLMCLLLVGLVVPSPMLLICVPTSPVHTDLLPSTHSRNPVCHFLLRFQHILLLWL